MGPLGCKIIVHVKPGQCGSLAFNGVTGFYIGTFMNGYITYTVYIPDMRAERSTDTVNFFLNKPK